MGLDRPKESDKGAALAGKSTLNRLELGSHEAHTVKGYKKIVCHPDKVEEFFATTFLNSHDKAPKEIVLDFDATDDPLHGDQEGRFFHGYYGNYCYLPLYVFCGDHVLVSKLRASNCDAADGSKEELERLVILIRKRWPEVRIIVRGDSGFCRDNIMSWSRRRMTRILSANFFSLSI